MKLIYTHKSNESKTKPLVDCRKMSLRLIASYKKKFPK